jgi:aldose 1-epimerase
VHPYLVAGPGRVDDWTFELDASRVLAVDPERLLPQGLQDVAGTEQDFRGGRSLRGLAVDHAFTGVGRASARVLAADGGGVEMTWDGDACPWVQVHTADRPEPEDDRVGLALEPMTCPPDALRSGVDLVELAPGASHRTWWRIAPVAP